jgi:hypothetical protein
MSGKKGHGKELRHSVAFRVSEKEWQTLQNAAGERRTTVPQLAKQLLFESMGWRMPPRARRGYGQAISRR